MPSRRPLRRWLALLLAAALLVLAPATVSAHSELATSDPADGATVEGTPAEIVGTFTEPLADGSSLTLRDAAGATLATGAPEGADPVEISFEPPELEPGTYTLEWTAVATDGHVDRGTVTFEVAAAPTPSPTPTPEPTASPDASPTPVATPEPTPAASPSPDPDTTGDGATESAVIPIVVALAFLAGLGAYLIRRRSARG
jgi:methionine-rich copper-binding protein CopC